MKPSLLLTCLLLAAPALAPAAATTINFNGAITSSGPGSMAVFGGLTTAYNTVSGFGLAAMTGGNPQVLH